MEEIDGDGRRAEGSAVSAGTETTKWIKYGILVSSWLEIIILYGKRPHLLKFFCRIQDILKKRLTTTDDFSWRPPISNPSTMADKETSEVTAKILRYVGGFDVSYSKDDSSMACGVLVVLDLPTLQVVYEDFCFVDIRVPYAPGFLAFREAPVCLQLLEKMKKSDSSSLYPQLLMVDGNGLLHPRGKLFLPSFGSACQVGVLADLPTIGIGKNLHHVDGLTQSGVRQLLQAKENSISDFITLKGFSGCTWGVAMRPSAGAVKPIFISVGHRISLETAVKIVKISCKFRVPEPVRQADIRSREHLKNHETGSVGKCSSVNLTSSINS
ncbi:Endonuclease V [Linum perenne]